MNIAVVGSAGRLGSEIVKNLKENDNGVIEIDEKSEIKSLFDIKPKNIEVIIDVSTHSNSVTSAQFAKKFHIPIEIGCTGHSEDELSKIKYCAKFTPILLCYNFSFGVLALKFALEEIVGLSTKKAFICETHHKFKKDAPSGTAKELENILKKHNIDIYPTISIRESSVVGKHVIQLFGDDEIISISHEAISRKCFSNGAVKAIEFLKNSPNGLYSLKDLISKM